MDCASPCVSLRGSISRTNSAVIAPGMRSPGSGRIDCGDEPPHVWRVESSMQLLKRAIGHSAPAHKRLMAPEIEIRALPRRICQYNRKKSPHFSALPSKNESESRLPRQVFPQPMPPFAASAPAHADVFAPPCRSAFPPYSAGGALTARYLYRFIPAFFMPEASTSPLMCQVTLSSPFLEEKNVIFRRFTY